MRSDLVTERLAIGSCPRGPHDVAELKRRYGITAVVSLQPPDETARSGVDPEQLQQVYRLQGVVAERVPIRDFAPDELLRALPACLEVLARLHGEGHSVYLHCHAGENRSPTVAIAYLHARAGMKLDAARDLVEMQHPCAPYAEVLARLGELLAPTPV